MSNFTAHIETSREFETRDFNDFTAATEWLEQKSDALKTSDGWITDRLGRAIYLLPGEYFQQVA